MRTLRRGGATHCQGHTARGKAKPSAIFPPSQPGSEKGEVSLTLDPSAARLCVKSLPTQPHAQPQPQGLYPLSPRGGSLTEEFRAGRVLGDRWSCCSLSCLIRRTCLETPRSTVWLCTYHSTHRAVPRSNGQKVQDWGAKGLHRTSPLAAQLWGSQLRWATFLTPSQPSRQTLATVTTMN